PSHRGRVDPPAGVATRAGRSRVASADPRRWRKLALLGARFAGGVRVPTILLMRMGGGQRYGDACGPVNFPSLLGFLRRSRRHERRARRARRSYASSLDPHRSNQNSGAGGAPADFFSSGFSVTTASVVSSSPATEDAFCSAVRTTLVGSMIPAFMRSVNSSA